MRVIWSPPARTDLVRLRGFLAPKNEQAAANMLRGLRAGALRLVDHPRLGERIERIETLEVRRIFVHDYELRYEVRTDVIVVLRIWQSRENR
jgi:plasmid stabilization system protein ParE